ncbi:MAG TPA: hypothetical protein VGN12_25985 [Pirellulales bacterium]
MARLGTEFHPAPAVTSEGNEARGGHFRVASEYLAQIKHLSASTPGVIPISAEVEYEFRETIPIWRRWLGDKTFDTVGLPHDATKEELARVRGA